MFENSHGFLVEADMKANPDAEDAQDVEGGRLACRFQGEFELVAGGIAEWIEVNAIGALQDFNATGSAVDGE